VRGPGHDGGFFFEGKIKTRKNSKGSLRVLSNNQKKHQKAGFLGGSFQEAFCGGLFENVVTQVMSCTKIGRVGDLLWGVFFPELSISGTYPVKSDSFTLEKDVFSKFTGHKCIV